MVSLEFTNKMFFVEQPSGHFTSLYSSEQAFPKLTTFSTLVAGDSMASLIEGRFPRPHPLIGLTIN